MRFYKNLFLGETIEDIEKVDIILDKLSKNTSVFGVFCICIEPSSKSLSEIISSMEIFKSHYEQKKYIVIGLANGKKEAYNLMADIIANHLKVNHTLKNFKSILGEELENI